MGSSYFDNNSFQYNNKFQFDNFDCDYIYAYFVKIGFNKQGSVVLLLLSSAIGSCLNPGYHILYANLLSWNIDKVKDFYYIMAVVGVIALVFIFS